MNPARATTTDLANLTPGWSRVKTASAAKQQQALNSASDYLDGKLDAQYDLPLSAPYPQDVIEFECVYAGTRLLMNLGLDPESAADKAIIADYERKLKWADDVAKGEVPVVGLSALGGEVVSGPDVITATSRGYSERGLTNGSTPHPHVGPFSDD